MAKTWNLCVKYSLMSHIIILNVHNRVYIFIHSAGFCEVWRVRVKETRRHINVLNRERARVQCIFNMVYLHCFSFYRRRREKVLYSPNANRAPPRCQCHEKSCHTLIWAQILASHKHLLSRRYRNFPESIVFRIWHGRLTLRRGRTYSWNPKRNVLWDKIFIDHRLLFRLMSLPYLRQPNEINASSNDIDNLIFPSQLHLRRDFLMLSASW